MPLKDALRATVLIVTAALASACSADAVTTGAGHADHYDAPGIVAAADNPAELADFIRATVSYDFEPVANPGLLRQKSDVAVLGRVAAVEDALLKTDAEDMGGVLISLNVDEVWKDDPARQTELVHYVIPRPTNIDVALYRDALPVGTRVALFGYHTVETLVLGQPLDVVYDPAPQGLIFESGPGRAVNVWGEEVTSSGWRNIHDIDDLRAEAQRP
jgi:hypothetical protein